MGTLVSTKHCKTAVTLISGVRDNGETGGPRHSLCIGSPGAQTRDLCGTVAGQWIIYIK